MHSQRAVCPDVSLFFFFNDTATTEIYTLSLHDALPIFLNKNRSDIKLEPFQMHQFAPVFMKLAADALAAEMDRSAFELYALVPSTQAAIDDINARLLQIVSIDRRLGRKSAVEGQG